MGDEKPQMQGDHHEMMMKHMMHKMMQMHGRGPGPFRTRHWTN
jgi:hypothetical protein